MSINNDIVKKSNELIESRFILPMSAQKLICYCATKINDENNDFDSVEVFANDLQILRQTQNPYRELKNIANELFEAEIITKNAAGEFKVRKRWVTTLEYFEGEGRIVFKFHPDVKPFLLQIKEKYTEYNIRVIEKLYNKYSLRLYEYLIKHDPHENNIYVVNVTIEDMKQMFMIEDKYDKFADLRRYVLDPMVEELNLTDIKNVEYCVIKKGRKADSITFKFSK